MKALDDFYLRQEEPVKATLLALKEIVALHDKDITSEWKYGMPCFCYKRKMFCYLWVHKKYKQPYLGIVEGKYFNQSFLLQEKRSRMKIMLFDPDEDLPIKAIKAILQQALDLYKKGVVKL